jgi:hypothetical protein
MLLSELIRANSRSVVERRNYQQAFPCKCLSTSSPGEFHMIEVIALDKKLIRTIASQ